MSDLRTDRNRNPTAMTIDVARAGGLVLGVDYVAGDSFEAEGRTYYTAKFLGDPLALTIKAITSATFYTHAGRVPRWEYIAIPMFLWHSFTLDVKVDVIGSMYGREGGVAMRGLFPRILPCF